MIPFRHSGKGRRPVDEENKRILRLLAYLLLGAVAYCVISLFLFGHF